MSLTIAQIRAQLRNMTGHDSVTLPDADSGEIQGCNTFLNLAWWSLIDELELRDSEKNTTTPTIDGTEFYTLPGSDIYSVRKMSYVDPITNLSIAIQQRDLEFFRRNKDNNDFSQGRPLFYIRDGLGYYLMPVPDDIYTIDIDYLGILTDADVGGMSNAPRQTGEIVKYGAAWRIFLDVNGNIQKATYFKNLESNLIAQYTPVKAKEEDNNPLAGLNYIGRRYEL